MAAGLAKLIGTSLKSFAKTQAKKKVANAGKKMLSRKPPEEENKTQTTPQTPETGPKTTYTQIKPSSSLVPFKGIIDKSSKASRSSGDTLTDIQLRVAEIEKIVSINFKFKKVQKEKTRLGDEKKKFKDREDKLESGLNMRGFNFPFSIPGKGMFDKIMESLIRFLLFITLGKLLPTIIKFLPTLQGILTTLAKIVGTIADMFGNILDGLIGFATWVDGIKERSKEIARSIGGDNLVGVIENFESAFGQFLNLALIAGMLTMGGSGPSSNKSGGKPSTRIRGPKGVSGRSGSGVNPSAARRYAQKFGKDAAIKRFGQEGVKSLGGKYARSGATNLARKGLVGTLGKGGTKAAINIVKPLVKNIPLIGGIMEFVLSWISGDPVGRAAFKGVGAGLGTWVGGALGTLMGPGIGNAIGMFLGGMGGAALGGMLYDGIFAGKPAPKPKTNIQSKNAGGKVTRAGKSVGGRIRRSAPKQKTVKKPSPLKIPLQPGKDAGGIDKIKKLYDAEKKGGIFGFSKVLNPGSPYVVLEELSEIFKNIPFIGNWMGSAIDIALGQKPSERLYQNYADSLGYFISNIVQNRVSSATSKVFGLLSKLESGGTVASAGTSIRDIQTELDTKDISETISMLVRNDMNKALQVVRDAANIKISKAGTPGGDYLPGDGGYGEGGGGSSGEFGESNLEYTGKFKGSGKDMAKQIYARLIADGIPPAAAAGIVGNIGAESNFDPAIIEKGTGIGRGWIQWSYGRRTAFERWAKNNNLNPDTAEANYRYLMHEMQGKDGNHWMPRSDTPRHLRVSSLAEYIEKAKDPETAAKLFMYNYERPNRRVQHLNRRIDYAQDVSKTDISKITKEKDSSVGSGFLSNLGKNLPGLTLSGQAYRASRDRGSREHAGRDYDLGDNDTFYSRIGGVVIFAGNVGGGYGNVVDIYNKDLNRTERIAEGTTILSGIKVGQTVSPGQPVVRGTHQTGVIHYEIRKGKAGASGHVSGTEDPDAFLNSKQYKEYITKLKAKENDNVANSKVIRSFKVGSDTYTEREGGVYTQNGNPISKAVFDAVVKNRPNVAKPSPVSRPATASQITPEQAGSYVDRLRNMKPGSGESLRIPGVGTVVQGRNIFGRPEEKYFNPDGTPAKKDEFFNRVRNKLPNTSRMQGGGVISPKQPNNPNVSKFSSYEDPFVNNKQIVLVPIPVPQKAPTGTSQASMPVTAMKFVPTTKDSSNIDPHFRV